MINPRLGCVFSLDMVNTDKFHIMNRLGTGVFKTSSTLDDKSDLNIGSNYFESTVHNWMIHAFYLLFPYTKCTYRFKVQANDSDVKQWLLYCGPADDGDYDRNNFEIAIESDNQTIYVFTETVTGTNHVFTYDTGVNLNDGNIHDIVVAIDGNNLDEYVDKVNTNSDSSFIPATGCVELNEYYLMGKRDATGGYLGKIYNIDCFSRKLSDSEINKLCQ